MQKMQEQLLAIVQNMQHQQQVIQSLVTNMNRFDSTVKSLQTQVSGTHAEALRNLSALVSDCMTRLDTLASAQDSDFFKLPPPFEKEDGDMLLLPLDTVDEQCSKEMFVV